MALKVACRSTKLGKPRTPAQAMWKDILKPKWEERDRKKWARKTLTKIKTVEHEIVNVLV